MYILIVRQVSVVDKPMDEGILVTIIFMSSLFRPVTFEFAYSHTCRVGVCRLAFAAIGGDSRPRARVFAAAS